MNISEAKLIVFMKDMNTDLRYAELLATKMGVYPQHIGFLLRRMKHNGWINQAKHKNRMIVTAISEEALNHAQRMVDDRM